MYSWRPVTIDARDLIQNQNTLMLVDGVWKRYQRGDFSVVGLGERFRGLRGATESASAFWALSDVSFALDRGEILGVIGPNGAGKTTILRLLSRISTPTKGRILSRGRIAALIALGAGFHPDLTGRDNVFLNAAILGMRRAQIVRVFDEIVAFSGLERFIDTPVKRYSSGMYARLGFSVAAFVEPDILLVDEVLSVGDTAFQLKCFARIEQLRAAGTGIIFVSHNMRAIQRMCSSALVLNSGTMTYVGPAADAIAVYDSVVRAQRVEEGKSRAAESGALANRLSTGGATIGSVVVLDEAGSIARIVQSGQVVCVQYRVSFAVDAPSPVFACTVLDDSGMVVYDATTVTCEQPAEDFSAGDCITVRVYLQLVLLNGTYSIKLDVAYSDLTCYYDYVSDACSFVVTRAGGGSGTANLAAEFEFVYDP